MKKFIAMLAAVVLLMGLGSACSSSGGAAKEDTRTAAEIWEEMSETVDSENLPSFMDLDAAGLESYYGLTDAEAADYLCKFPLMNVTASEILIVKCVSGQEDAVKAAAEKRQADLAASWGSYLPAQLELVEDYRLVQNGQWLLFVVSDQADAIEEAFNTATK